MFRLGLICLSLALAPGFATAQAQPEIPPRAERPADAAMTPERLVRILLEIDPEAQAAPGAIVLGVDDVPVTVIFDAAANRMRAIVPIASVPAMAGDEMLRLLQANFDSALDARYAIAEGRVWAVFIHPLAELDRRQLISGVAQTVALAQTYGTTYSSTNTMFRRGDSADRLRELLDRGEEL